MPVGLLTNSGAGPVSRIIAVNTADVDLHALFGSPSIDIKYTLVIPSGVTVSSSDSTIPSLDATGFTVGTIGTWVVDGDITGAGGGGGDGFLAEIPLGKNAAGGGGGGGAGAIVGTGGTGVSPATDGADGTATEGGIGGVSASAVGAGNAVATGGTDGGDSVQLNHAVTIVLSGTIGSGGGGGGGASGVPVVTPDGGDGGDLGEAGDEGGDSASPGGSAGFAIRYSESGDATITGGTVIGTVG